MSRNNRAVGRALDAAQQWLATDSSFAAAAEAGRWADSGNAFELHIGGLEHDGLPVPASRSEGEFVDVGTA